MPSPRHGSSYSIDDLSFFCSSPANQSRFKDILYPNLAARASLARLASITVHMPASARRLVSELISIIPETKAASDSIFALYLEESLFSSKLGNLLYGESILQARLEELQRQINTPESYPKIIQDKNSLEFMSKEFKECPYLGCLSEFRDKIQEALLKILEIDLAFSNWVRRVVNRIVPIDSDPSVLRSGSNALYPGVIAISCHKSVYGITESFIHEAAHQYFNYLSGVTSMWDVNSDEKIYSPLKMTMRPTEKLLIGYHAFASVAAFYVRAISKVSSIDETFQSNMSRTFRDVAMLENGLEKSKKLTDFGRRFFEVSKSSLRKEAGLC